jgi:hypothetical protein
MGQRGSGHLAVTGSANWATGMSHHKDQPAKQTNHRGVYVCQHLSIAVVGKACSAEQCQGQNRVGETPLLGIAGRLAETWA